LGDIFSSILSKTDIHVSVVKGYILPKTVDSNTLVIATSISGNTVETLSVLKSAIDLPCKVIAFSSNGRMKDFCENNKIEFRNIPMEHSPRASFTGFFYGMLKVLQPILPITNKEIEESLEELEKIRQNISSNNLNQNNKALNLAEWITGIPVIYFPAGLNAAAIRFKNSLQENSKIHTMAEDVIEACHNGIMAWEISSKVQPILLQGEDDLPKTKERWIILKEFFNDRQIDYREINSVKGGIISKLINLIYLLDYTSIYLAIMNKIDPTSIDSINFIKERLDIR
jgi:glucose/mannose-6-phosphate isomerase